MNDSRNALGKICRALQSAVTKIRGKRPRGAHNGLGNICRALTRKHSFIYFRETRPWDARNILVRPLLRQNMSLFFFFEGNSRWAVEACPALIVWCDSFLCVTWHVWRQNTTGCVVCDSFICVRRVHMCYIYIYICVLIIHMCVIWLIHMCTVRSYVLYIYIFVC